VSTESAPRPAVLITGAAGGIGAATSRRFAMAGADLALCDRQPFVDIADLREVVEGHGAQLIHETLDVADRAAVAAFVRRAEEELQRIDVLVTAAGILASIPADALSWEEWDRFLAVNLSGTWAFVRAVIPGMLARGHGRIITISSELGIIGLETYAGYCASKGAVIAMTKALARELAPRGILVNSVAPGPVLTDMLRSSPEFESDYVTTLPLRRFGEADEIASTIEFLAGPGGSFFVGQIISPNGGAAI
jgi:3-oxoacyl-[acyl-carrier protein] reductase